MFNKTIANTPLTSSAADAYFSNRITGDGYLRDKSFLATMRALLDPRMSESDHVNLSFTTDSYSKRDLENTTVSNAISALSNPGICNFENQIRIHDFRNRDQDSNMAWLKMVEENFESKYPGWKRVTKVTLFCQKVFYVLCYINPDIKGVIIFTEFLDIRKLHYLQCGILAFFPWFFDPKDGVSELEMRLIESLRSKSEADYEVCISQIAEKYDFRTTMIKQMLGDFERNADIGELQTAERTISNYTDEIRRLQERMREYISGKHDAEIRYAGILAKMNDEEGSEIMDYFLCNKNIMPVSVEGSTMRFVATGYLSYFNEEFAETMIRNRHSTLYNYRHGVFNSDDLEKLYRAIFLDQTIRVRFCAAYELIMHEGVYAKRNFDYSDFRGYTPNPHIDFYACLGDHERHINECVMNNNYIGAIEQCVSSNKSLNLMDGPVMSSFIDRFCDTNSSYRHCLELPDGRVVDPLEAIAYIKTKEAEAGNE